MEHTVARVALMPRFCPLPSSVYLHLLLLLLLFFQPLLLRSPPSWSATTGLPHLLLPLHSPSPPPPRRSSSDKPPATAAGDIMTARPQTSNLLTESWVLLVVRTRTAPRLAASGAASRFTSRWSLLRPPMSARFVFFLSATRQGPMFLSYWIANSQTAKGAELRTSNSLFLFSLYFPFST